MSDIIRINRGESFLGVRQWYVNCLVCDSRHEEYDNGIRDRKDYSLPWQTDTRELAVRTGARHVSLHHRAY